MGALAREQGRGTLAWSLRLETARIRNLTAECREANVFYEDLPEELRSVRALVERKDLDGALEHLRELKLELLARLLLQEPQPTPPAGIENAPPASSPTEATLSALNAGVMPDAPVAARTKASR